MDFTKFINCSIEYENRSNVFIETDLDEAKALFLNQNPDSVRKFKAYKALSLMSDSELDKVFDKGYRRLRNGILDKKTKQLYNINTEIEVTNLF